MPFALSVYRKAVEMKGMKFLLIWKYDKTEHDALDEQNIPKFHLDLNMYQRSCDFFLGVPTNIASMSLLLLIIAKASNMVAGVSNWVGGDTHLYVDHMPMAKEQLERRPFPLAEVKINKKLDCLDDILALTIDDFELNTYISHETIKAELFVGNKK